jgi:hypothetical protein
LCLLCKEHRCPVCAWYDPSHPSNLFPCRSIESHMPLSHDSEGLDGALPSATSEASASKLSPRGSIHDAIPQVVALLAAGYQCSSKLILALDRSRQAEDTQLWDLGPLLCFHSSVSSWARVAMERTSESFSQKRLNHSFENPHDMQHDSSQTDAQPATNRLLPDDGIFKVQQISSLHTRRKDVQVAVQGNKSTGYLCTPCFHLGVKPKHDFPWELDY